MPNAEPRPHSSHLLVAENLPALLFEDSQWLVLDKPAGWLTRAPLEPSSSPRSPFTPILVEWAKTEWQIPLWIVHRLDRETSGVNLFAKNAEAHRQASLFFEKREVFKRYAFVAAGSPRGPAWQMKSRIQNKDANTRFEVVQRGPSAYLGHAFPKSGRRHQIRIHLKDSGTPILGDTLYGGPSQSRVFLHACELKLPGMLPIESQVPPLFYETALIPAQKTALSETSG